MQAYGHGGFWGTVGQHVPELNASIAVFVLERDKREIRKDVLDAVGGVLKARIRGG
jgi:CubicO group peptidase (beta-lactamase class C family)